MEAPVSVYENRGLVRSMVRRDLEARYRGSLLGALWALASPLFLILVYSVFFGLFLRIRPTPDAGAADYGLFVMAGMLPWMAISDAISQSTGVILTNRNLVQKVVFPIEILPAIVVLAAFVSQLIGLAVLGVAILLFTEQLPIGLVLLPVAMLPQLLLTLGLSWFLASVGVFLRDLSQAMSIILMTGMLMTPILYPASSVPEEFHWIIELNPISAIIAMYRVALLEAGTITPEMFAYPFVVGLLCFFAGGYWFTRTRHAFADVL